MSQAPARVIDPLGQRTTFTVSSGERIITIQTPLSNVTRFRYANDFATLRQDPNNNRTSVLYTTLTGGRTVSRSIIMPSRYRTTFLYDGNDRMRAFLDPFGTRSTLIWDGSGNRIAQRSQ